MQEENDEGVGKVIREYLCEQRVQREQAQRLVRIGQLLGQSGLQNMLIQKMFTTIQLEGRQDNFRTMVKRYLHLLNRLLQPKGKKYYQIHISQHLKELYLFVFTNIFKYSLHNLIIDLKSYRMKWAKIITDQAYDGLREKIKNKFHNFDLNKGIPPQIFEKIKEKYIKRGFKSHQIQYYMGKNSQKTEKVNDSIEQNLNKRKQIQSSEQSSSSQKVKKIKMNQNIQRSNMYDKNHNNTQANHLKSRYNPHLYGNYQQSGNLGMIQHRNNHPKRSINQIMYPPVFYPPKPSQEITDFVKSQGTTAQSPGNSHSSTPFHDYNIVREIDDMRYSTDTSFQILERLKQGLIQCHHCGLCFITQKSHSLHLQQHFLQSEKKYQSSISNGRVIRNRKIHSYLPTLEQWKQLSQKQDKDKQCQIAANSLRTSRHELLKTLKCFCCNEEISLVWSFRLGNWAYAGVLKIKINGTIYAIHQNCYFIFREEQKTF